MEDAGFLVVRIVPFFPLRDTRHLRLGYVIVPQLKVGMQRQRDVALARLGEAQRDRRGILDGLARALGRGRQERVGGVAHDGDEPRVADPLVEARAEHELPVEDVVDLFPHAHKGGVPAWEQLQDILPLAGDTPAFVYVGDILVGEDRVDLLAVSLRGDNPMHVGAYPDVHAVSCGYVWSVGDTCSRRPRLEGMENTHHPSRIALLAHRF